MKNDARKSGSRLSKARRAGFSAPIRSCASSRGVVLILVLGILSVMVLMAFAFSVSMRTERVASEHFSDGVRARQLVYAALARAMEQINSEMGDGLWQSDAQIYPEWGVTNSLSDPAAYTSAVDLLKGEAADFVPRALWNDASQANSNSPSAHWINLGSETRSITHTAEMTGEIKTVEQKSFAGRAAYLILNCSGLLDANYAGGASSRQVGISPSEIALADMPEFTVTNVATFTANRAKDIRYETLQELFSLNECIATASNLFVYSRFPSGCWTNGGAGSDGVATGLYIIGKSKSELQPDEIKEVFRQSVTTNEAQVDLLYQNLLHYVDDDHGVGGITNAYVEHVPMLNEIFMSNEIVTNEMSGSYDIKCQVFFELWNPFVENITRHMELIYSITFTNASPSTAIAFPAPLINEVKTVFPVFTQETFRVIAADQRVVKINLPAETPLASVEFDVLIRPEIWQLVEPRSQVDGFTNDAVFKVKCADTDSYVQSLECLDPRFNWAPDPDASEQQWFLTDSPSTGQINRCTYEALDRRGVTNDGNTAMYVADKPLQSLGELGYLVYAPWQTVKVFGEQYEQARLPDSNGRRLLDFFEQNTNSIRHGLVNPNTLNIEALAAVFSGLPIDRSPDDSFGARLSWTQAVQIADSIIDNGPYTNISDVYRAMTNDSTIAELADSKLQKEAFVRNTIGLLNVRQNLFTIIIEAQVARGNIIPTRPVRQRAVAIVWRDPYTGETLLRSIKWLND